MSRLRLLAFCGNVAVLSTLSVLGITEGLPDGEELIVIALFFAVPVLTLWALAARPPERGLRARDVLELDTRLEALERSQADALDAARWRGLVEAGYASPPPVHTGGARPPSAGRA